MKKKLIYFFIGFILILCIAYLFRYKLSDSFKNKIPKGTTAILKVNTRQLEHHFLTDFLSRPLSYLKTGETAKKDSATTKKKAPSLFKGVKIPKNILFYSKDTTYTKTWVSTKIKIKNAKIIDDLLILKGYKSTLLKEVTIYSKKLVSIIIKEDHLIITYNSTNKNANSYFNEQTFLDKASLLLQKLNDCTSDVYYVSINNEELKANLNKGNISIIGNANFDFLKNNTHQIDKSNIALIATTLNKETDFTKELVKQLNKDKFKNITKLNFDSIYKKWNGTINFNLKSFKTKIDTIKTYEYDDDFNKVEKIATQKTTNPSFMLSITSNTNLYGYLDNANTIKIIDSKSVFIPLPIVQTFVESTANKTIFHTSKTIKKLTKEINSKLIVDFDFDGYRKSTKNTPFYYFKSIKNVQKCAITISKENELDFKIEMKDKTRNALFQLIK